MTPTPSPIPTDGSWLTITGPLIVVPDGGWQVLISIVALLVSVSTLWYTLSARARVHASVMRRRLMFEADQSVVDGDEVQIFNLGRSASVIISVQARTAAGKLLSAKSMPRGFENDPVEFPALPVTLQPHGVLTVWFSKALAGEEAGIEHGYQITYLRPGLLRATKQRTLIVKAHADAQQAAPQPELSTETVRP